VSISAFAEGGHGPSGCGLGSEVIFRDAKLWHEHVMAATINQAASQTFAMTSGTLGCEDANGPFKHRVVSFIDQNLDQLAADFSKGTGETLETLSELFAISSQDSLEFSESVKRHFDLIFSSVETNSNDVYLSITKVMRNNEVLKKYLVS